jgi:hypothetical protein
VLATVAFARRTSARPGWSQIDDGHFKSRRILAVDAAGNLYVSGDWGAGPENDSWILKQDEQGNWSRIATRGHAVGQVNVLEGLALDGAGNLYVADTGNNWVQKYTPGP